MNRPGIYYNMVKSYPEIPGRIKPVVPALIGYTEKAVGPEGEDLRLRPVRVSSIEEFHAWFGGAFTPQLTLFIGKDRKLVRIHPNAIFYLYPSLKLFFDNGGREIVIVSVGPYYIGKKTNRVQLSHMKAGVDALKPYDLPGVLLFPDSVLLRHPELGSLQIHTLKHCRELKDRFSIFDLKWGDDIRTEVDRFRDHVGGENLDLGAAYYPWVKVNYEFPINRDDLWLKWYKQSPYLGTGGIKPNKPLEGHLPDKSPAKPLEAQLPAELPSKSVELNLPDKSPARPSWEEISEKSPAKPIAEETPEKSPARPPEAPNEARKLLAEEQPITHRDVAYPEKVLFAYETPTKRPPEFAKWPILSESQWAEISAQVQDYLQLLPPSGAVAGAYAATDRSRGVWKAPANLSLEKVVAPGVRLTAQEQEYLNVHHTGKSVNVLRTFPGRGVTIWGARTLLANSLEWRYVPVRRLFLAVEEVLQKALEPFVFEANASPTWTRVKSLVNGFILYLHEAGALAGASPQESGFVKLGLGETMTSQDILEGRMIVQIGLAAARPAEFIMITLIQEMEK